MSICLPLPAVPSISPAQASTIAARGRKLLRKGLLTHRQAILLDCLLWSVRKPGAGACSASYSALQRLAHVSRECVSEGIRRLASLGLLTIHKRRVRVQWIGAGSASRQAANAYVFHPANTESAEATVLEAISVSISSPIAAAEAQAALEAIRRRRAGIIAAGLTRTRAATA